MAVTIGLWFASVVGVAIVLETSEGNLSLALGLGFVLIGISIAVSATIFAYGARGGGWW